MESENPRLIDRYVPSWDIRTTYRQSVEAPPELVYRAAREFDLTRSKLATALFAVRVLPHLLGGKMSLPRRLNLQAFLDAGFVVLDEAEGEQLVLGAVGRFWRPGSDLLHITQHSFAAFSEPGFAKGVLDFTVEPAGGGALLATETRVVCTDDHARRRFLTYWRFVGPFSGLIRRVMLNEVKRSAEAASTG